MALSYLTGGEPILADDMNRLFEELDRKAALALDNHSLLYLLGESRDQTRKDFWRYLGQPFIFASGAQPVSGYWGTTPYDHSVFTSALASSVLVDTPNTYGLTKLDRVRGIATINPLPSAAFTSIGVRKGNPTIVPGIGDDSPSLLRYSLETHRSVFTDPETGEQKPFWVRESFNPLADTSGSNAFAVDLCRVKMFHQAEIIIEGRNSPSEFVIPIEWNRFRFFRIHNLDATPLTVRFESSAGTNGSRSLEVSPRSSKCVRRDLASGTYYEPVWAYTEGGRYFQKFLTGDPRFYQHTSAEVFSTANNVCDPSACIPFVVRLLGGKKFVDDSLIERRLCLPTVHLDPTVRAPLSSISDYSTLYADPSDTSAILGDLLHHKGNLLLSTTVGDSTSFRSVQFAGYSSLVSIDGIAARVVGDDCQIKRSDSGDILTLSTNLLMTGGNKTPSAHLAIDGSAWFSLYAVTPAVPEIGTEVEVVTTQFSYYQVTATGGLGPIVSLEKVESRVRVAAQPQTVRPLPHADTVQTSLAKYFQAGPGHTFSESRLELSSSGLVARAVRLLPLAHFSYGTASEAAQLSGNTISPIFSLSQSAFDTASVTVLENGFTLESNGIKTKHGIVFTGYGWPDVDAWEYTGVLTPRRGRYYSVASTGSGGLPIAQGHPDFTEGQDNIGGEDLLYIGNASAFDGTEIAPLTPYGSPSNFTYGRAGRLDNNDILFGAVGNIGNPQYWTAATGGPSGMETNRKRCFENQIFFNVPTDGSDYTHFEGLPNAVGMFRFIRMEMAAEHFNNMAALVNSITRYRPLNFSDHGFIQIGSDQSRRYRLRPNKSGLLPKIQEGNWFAGLTFAAKVQWVKDFAQYSGLRPVDQYACLDVPSSDDLVAIATAAGIPIRTVTDLPGWEHSGKKRRIATVSSSEADSGIHVPVVDTVTITNGTGANGIPVGQRLVNHLFSISDFTTSLPISAISETAPMRPDLVSVTQYRWVKVADVRAFAELMGWEFHHAVMGVEYDLRSVEISDRVSFLINHQGFDSRNEIISSGSTPGAISYLDMDFWKLVSERPRRQVEFNSIQFDARAVEFVRVASGGWICDGEKVETVTTVGHDWPGISVSLLCQYRTPEIPGLSGGSVRVFLNSAALLSGFGADLGKSYWPKITNIIPASTRNPSDFSPYLLAESCASRVSTTGANSVAQIKVDCNWVKVHGDFSSQSSAQAKALAVNGVNVLPLSVETVGGKRITLWSDFSSPTG